jgi:hypothetical protein
MTNLAITCLHQLQALAMAKVTEEQTHYGSIRPQTVIRYSAVKRTVKCPHSLGEERPKGSAWYLPQFSRRGCGSWWHLHRYAPTVPGLCEYPFLSEEHALQNDGADVNGISRDWPVLLSLYI